MAPSPIIRIWFVLMINNTHQLLAPRLTHLGALGPTINSAASLKTPWLGGTGCFPNYDVLANEVSIGGLGGGPFAVRAKNIEIRW